MPKPDFEQLFEKIPPKSLSGFFKRLVAKDSSLEQCAKHNPEFQGFLEEPTLERFVACNLNDDHSGKVMSSAMELNAACVLAIGKVANSLGRVKAEHRLPLLQDIINEFHASHAKHPGVREAMDSLVVREILFGDIDRDRIDGDETKPSQSSRKKNGIPKNQLESTPTERAASFPELIYLLPDELREVFGNLAGSYRKRLTRQANANAKIFDKRYEYLALQDKTELTVVNSVAEREEKSAFRQWLRKELRKENREDRKLTILKFRGWTVRQLALLTDVSKSTVAHRIAMVIMRLQLAAERDGINFQF